MWTPDGSRGGGRRLRDTTTAVTVASGLALVPPATAHEGTAHAGTPHYVLLGSLLVGLGLLAGSALLARRQSGRLRLVLGGVLVGAVFALLGTVGLVEIQVEPLRTDATPVPRSVYPLVGLVAGGLVLLATVNLWVWRWNDRPEYGVLGLLFGGWLLYPYVMPDGGYFHPLGHLLVVAVPVTVSYLLYREVWPALVETDGVSRLAGAAATFLFAVFVFFSTGQVTLNPEPITTAGGRVADAFLVVAEYRNPLVMWPAVEFYLPSTPLGQPVFGALNVGTALTLGLLAALVGTNAALAVATYRADAAVETSTGLLGGVATTGATACCCCAPALYAVVGGLLGASASPLYWAFLDSSSPLGALFFVGAVVLMTASTVRLARGLAAAGVCSLRSRETRPGDPGTAADASR